MKFLFIIILGLLATQSWALSLTPKQQKYWNKLLHYRAHWHLVGKVVSEVDSPEFFSHQEGKSSPVKEFERSVEILNSADAQKFVCRFPLRYKWLKSVVPNQWSYTTESCAIYNSFKEKLGAKSISLIFSSFYVNSPGSTFGHTFLRIGRWADFKQNELLDYAINFAAEDREDNALLYMFKGLFGYYPSRFSVIPYYYKIREYNDHEFRDIWDYDLALNQEQVDRVIDHVWELGQSYFDYFYFTENCSYHIFGLLNVAYDDINIMEAFNNVYVLPVETVKSLKEFGLIRDRKVKPSSYKRLQAETRRLDESELSLVKEIAVDPKKVSEVLKQPDQKKAANLLDASIAALDYLKAEKVLLNDPVVAEERQALLIARAENPEISKDLTYTEIDTFPPEESHKASRIGLSAGGDSAQNQFGSFEWRAAQHDLLDPWQGQLKNSQVTIFDATLRVETNKKSEEVLVLERFRMFDVKNYQPSDFWEDTISYEMGIGLDRNPFCASRNCLNPAFNFGGGSTVAVTQNLNLTVLMGGTYLNEKKYEYDSLLSLGPKMNLLYLLDKMSFGLDVSYLLPTENLSEWHNRNILFNSEVRFHVKKNMSLFLRSQNFNQGELENYKGMAGIYFYH